MTSGIQLSNKISCRFNSKTLTERSVFRRVTRVRASADDEQPPVLMEDWRSFRASLVSSQNSTNWQARKTEENLDLLAKQNPRLAQEDMWAHPLGAPEAGGLILATSLTPTLIGREFWQTVILLLEHGPDGSAGVILNRPTGLTLKRISDMFAGALPATVTAAFSDQTVYTGGFHAQQMLSVIHGHSKLAGAVEIASGVYYCNHEVALGGVLERALPPNDFKFFAGCVAFGPNELQADCDRGAWVPVACSRNITLKHCLRLPRPLWLEINMLLGDKYAEEARRQYDEMNE